jgi:hypothetical protein
LLSSRRLGRAETDGEELTLLRLVSSRPLEREDMDGEELTSKGNKSRERERERERNKRNKTSSSTYHEFSACPKWRKSDGKE